MALSNHDIDYIVNAVQPTSDGLNIASDQMNSLLMHVDNGDIELPIFDEAFLRKLTHELKYINKLLTSYVTELKTRKQ